MKKDKQIIVISEEEFLNMPPKRKKRWKGYFYEVIRSTYSNLQNGDLLHSELVKDGIEMALSEILSQVSNFYWLEWTTFPIPDSEIDLIYDVEEKIGDNLVIENSLMIKRLDGIKLNMIELKYIGKKLKLAGWI